MGVVLVENEPLTKSWKWGRSDKTTGERQHDNGALDEAAMLVDEVTMLDNTNAALLNTLPRVAENGQPLLAPLLMSDFKISFEHKLKQNELCSPSASKTN